MTMPYYGVTLVRYSDPDRKSLAHAAAVYLGKPDTDNTRRPLTMIKKRDALTIFRGESARFEFRTSKVVFDHLVRYSTLNMVACGGLRANLATEFVVPPEILGTPMEDLVRGIGNDSLEIYRALAGGIDPETQEPTEKLRLQAARSVAPMSVKLHYVMEFNFGTLIEAVFPQRIWTPGAQLDTRLVVEEMYSHVFGQDPELWGLIYDYYGPEFQTWVRAFQKMKKDDPAGVQAILDKYPVKSMWK
jgi:hypothetical protein